MTFKLLTANPFPILAIGTVINPGAKDQAVADTHAAECISIAAKSPPSLPHMGPIVSVFVHLGSNTEKSDPECNYVHVIWRGFRRGSPACFCHA